MSLKMISDWSKVESCSGGIVYARREGATLYLKYRAMDDDFNKIGLFMSDAELITGYSPKPQEFYSQQTEHNITVWVRIPSWEKEIFDPLPQNAPAFQPYYFTGDPTVDTGGTTVALPADDSRHIRVTIPGMEPTKEGYCTVSVQVGDKTESLVVKESELSKVRISLVPKIVII